MRQSSFWSEALKSCISEISTRANCQNVIQAGARGNSSLHNSSFKQTLVINISFISPFCTLCSRSAAYRFTKASLWCLSVSGTINHKIYLLQQALTIKHESYLQSLSTVSPQAWASSEHWHFDRRQRDAAVQRTCCLVNCVVTTGGTSGFIKPRGDRFGTGNVQNVHFHTLKCWWFDIAGDHWVL